MPTRQWGASESADGASSRIHTGSPLFVRKWCYAASGVPAIHGSPIRHSGGGRNPEGRGLGNVVRGLVPRWAEEGRGRIPRANSPYKTTTPSFHTLACRRQPG